MINLFFFLKFKSQLRRTRPDLVRQVDESLIKTIKDAGGKITGDRFVISAVFNEDSIGFWLNMYILIENLKKNVEIPSQFFGYALLFSEKQSDSPELLCRFLANHSGVFADEKISEKLQPYASFEKPSEWMRKIKTQKYKCSDYYRIRELKVFKPLGKYDEHLKKDVINFLKKEKGKNILILGPYYLNMNCGVKTYCSKLNRDFPVIKFCFERIGIGSLVDIWSYEIRSLAEGQKTAEIDSLYDFLFLERIRDEVSEYVIRSAKRFLSLIFDFYFSAANKRKQRPVFVLENVHLAEENVIDLLFEALAEINHENRQKLVILGTGEDSILPDMQAKWEGIFDKVKKIDNIKLNVLRYPKLSSDLWEIIYAISLFNRYFSPELFQRLFEEDKENSVMITRAFSILHTLGVIESIRQPRLLKRHFEEYSCNVLENKTDRAKELVCRRLVDWAVRRNINPCCRLLLIIADLNGIKHIDDLLLLKSFSSDIVNKTTKTIEKAVKNRRLEKLFTEKNDAIYQIIMTSKALISGNEKDIKKVFSNIETDNLTFEYEAFPILKAQIIINHCSYYLGSHDFKIASNRAKEVILLAQDRIPFCLPQGYRLFSLACLSKKQVNETIEYLGFALINAEKSGNYHELAVSAYYSAAAQFLHGDIYNAGCLARKSIEQSLSAGCYDWADRSRFLEGRIEFDLGNYSKAHDIFAKLYKDPYGSMTCEKENLLASWIYRTKIYFEDPQTPKPEPANNDADLFEIEAAYLAGAYEKAIALSASHINIIKEEEFLYTEQADWRSGFAQCEHLFFTQEEIQKRMITLFHSLALSRLSSSQSEEAKNNIQQILRDERLCEMDPCDALYFYAKYRILEQSGASQVDMSTAVSMAFKRLQRRAGRIGDSETRRLYMNGSRWNRELSLAAKEFKLI